MQATTQRILGVECFGVLGGCDGGPRPCRRDSKQVVLISTYSLQESQENAQVVSFQRLGFGGRPRQHINVQKHSQSGIFLIGLKLRTFLDFTSHRPLQL